MELYSSKHWNSFIGKKILMIYKYRVKTLIITGCDPDIGICLNKVGDPCPEVIYLGPSAPNYSRYDGELSDEGRKEYLKDIFKCLQSGYYSEFADNAIDFKHYGYHEEFSLSAIAYPFSI